MKISRDSNILRQIGADYHRALDTILDLEVNDVADEMRMQQIQEAAEVLYGLIHARYIITTEGMNRMVTIYKILCCITYHFLCQRSKYLAAHFSRCPRIYCSGQPVLPTGLSDEPYQHAMNIFCPKCRELYYPRSKQQNVDGAFFGTTFCHLFLMINQDLVPQKYLNKKILEFITYINILF
jgi:casein kinase II subunit beta